MPLVQGLGFPGGETMIEPWLFMNWKRTYEYLYTAETVTAEEALSMGMVNRVVPRADLESTVEEFAAHVAKAPLSTLMATKQLVSRGSSWACACTGRCRPMSWPSSRNTSDAQAARMEMASRGQKPSDKAADGERSGRRNEPASTNGT